MNKLKVLIVDDEPDIREVLILFLCEEFEVEAVEAGNAREAIKELEARPHFFDICISDYNMPEGNGTLLYEFIRKVSPKLPFILSTSTEWNTLKKFHSPYSGYVEKPFKSQLLINEIKKLLAPNNKNTTEMVSLYVGMSLELLPKLSPICCPLYLKFSDDNYVKIAHQGTQIDQQFIQHFKNKNTNTIFALRSDYLNLIKRFTDRVNESLFYQSENDIAIQGPSVKLSTEVLAFIIEATKSFGWSQEIEELTKKNVLIVLSMIKQNKSLNKILENIDFLEPNYQALHSVLISLIATALLKELKINESEIRNLIFAAFFHDIALTPYLSENEKSFLMTIQTQRPGFKDEVEAVKKHPQLAYDLLEKLNFCPDEVKTIVLQHHERPDGSGFPKGLKNHEVSQLAAHFIVAEELAVQYLAHHNLQIIKKDWLDKNIFQVTPFKKFDDLVRKWLIES